MRHACDVLVLIFFIMCAVENLPDPRRGHSSRVAMDNNQGSSAKQNKSIPALCNNIINIGEYY